MKEVLFLHQKEHLLIESQEQLQVLEKQKEQLQYLAITDDLTKLHNRRYFFTTLANEWKRSERYKRSLSIILFDIDHFKQFNDTHGHAIGDEVLKHVADIIKLTVREIDTVARFGGEEFMVLLPETDLDTAIGIAERIRREVDSKDFNHPVIENLSVTISGGISTKCDEKGAMNPDGMIRQADMAMYKAKQGGRNRVEAYHG